MEQLMLVNPHKRRRGKRRTPPRGPGGRFLKRSARSSTSRRRRRRRNPAHALPALAMNPRRRRSGSRAVARRRYRRNPDGFGRGFMRQLTAPLMPAVQGAAGAIANDVVFGFIPLPAQFKTGYIGIAAKAAQAVVLGMMLSRVVGLNATKQMTAGALTVLAYQTIKPMVAGVVPGLGYEGAGYAPDMGEFISDVPSSLSDVPSSLNEYLSQVPTGVEENQSDLY